MQKTIMTIGIATLAAGSALGWAQSDALAKEKKPELVSYKKDSGVGMGAFGGKLLHSYGYKDKQLENGNWQVTGQAKSSNPQHSQFIAIYRAAELATGQNKPIIQVVSVNGKSLGAVVAGSLPSGATFSGGSVDYGTRYVMEVTFVDTPDSEFHCAANVLRAECKTIEVAGAMAEIRPNLKIKAEK
jgi:hypothetical protein